MSVPSTAPISVRPTLPSAPLPRSLAVSPARAGHGRASRRASRRPARACRRPSSAAPCRRGPSFPRRDRRCLRPSSRRDPRRRRSRQDRTYCPRSRRVFRPCRPPGPGPASVGHRARAPRPRRLDRPRRARVRALRPRWDHDARARAAALRGACRRPFHRGAWRAPRARRASSGPCGRTRSRRASSDSRRGACAPLRSSLEARARATR